MKRYIYPIQMIISVNKLEILQAIFIQILNASLLFGSMYCDKLLLDVLEKKTFSNTMILSKEIILLLLIPAITMIIITGTNIISEINLSKQNLNFGMFIDKLMLGKIIELDLSCFDNPIFHNISASANSSKGRLNFLVYRVNFFLSNIINIIYIIIICIIGNKISNALLIILFTIPLLIIRSISSLKEFNYENENQHYIRKYLYMSDILLNKETAKEIRFYGIKDFFIKKYFQFWNPYFNGYKSIIKKYAILDSLLSILPYIILVFTQLTISQEIISHKLNIGDFTYYLAIFTTSISSLDSLVNDLSKVKECEIAVDYLNKFLKLNPCDIKQGNLELSCIEKIEFKNVSFTYPLSKEKALDGLNLQIDLSKSNAIVGLNGSGKSTVVKLLLRLYEINEGSILINKQDIRNYSIQSIRNKITVVFQDYIIFSLSLRFNIAVSDFDRRNSDKEIFDLINEYGLNSFLFRENENLDIQVGRDFDTEGIELSGGERQKLAVARALFKKNAKFLIMDEPNSSLDIKTEKIILKKIFTQNNYHVLFISHRLESTRKFDNILVLENGKLIENGTHDELIKIKGRYFEMFNIQAKKFSNNSEIGV